MSQKVLDALKAKFGDAVIATESQAGDEVALVKRDKLKDIATWLRDDKAMAFDMPVFVTCIDLLDWRPVKAPGEAQSKRPEWDSLDQKTPRFEVCWQLRSVPHRHRIRLKVALAENDV